MTALCFALSIAVPAFAGESNSLPDVYTITSDTDIPDIDAGGIETAAVTGQTSDIDGAGVIDVAVPDFGGFTLNPYGLPVDTATGISRDQIVSEPLEITNMGENPVSVWASAAGSVSGLSGACLVSQPPRSDVTEKEIFLYAEFKNDEGSWEPGYTGAENQILITDEVSEQKNVLTLDAGTVGWFQLFGSTAVDTEEDWSEDDVIHVTLAFTFTSDAVQTVVPEEKLEDADESEPDVDTEPEEEPEPGQDTESEGDSIPDVDTKTGEEPEPGQDAEPGDDSIPDVDTETGEELEPGQDAESADDSIPDVDSETGEELEPGQDTESEDDFIPDVDTETGEELEPGQDAESEDDSTPDGDTETEEEPEPGQDVETTDESIQELEPA